MCEYFDFGVWCDGQIHYPFDLRYVPSYSSFLRDSHTASPRSPILLLNTFKNTYRIHIISTGKKASIWGDEVTFPDEFSPNLTHDRRGILSMANRGPNTNKSQFFILYDAQPHLNNLHTVFGQVLDGWDVLDRWERLPNAHKTTPAEPPEITGFTIHANPLADEGITFPTPAGPPKKA